MEAKPLIFSLNLVKKLCTLSERRVIHEVSNWGGTYVWKAGFRNDGCK